MKPLYLAVLLVGGISVYLVGIRPNAEGTVYRVPIAQARQDLTKADLPPFVFGSQPLDVQVRGSIDSQIAWIVRRNGEELFRYIAQLKAEGDAATRVKVKLEGAGKYAQKLSDKPEIRDMYLIAMEEQVAATLERRPFEMTRIYPAMSAATVANMGALRSSVDQAAAASEQAARKNIEKAYRDEAAGLRR
ncbi:hypothetical protein [Bradyrhizobium jicamae]|nr:hypothetical protein [Bradyrhizobium jicamae]